MRKLAIGAVLLACATLAAAQDTSTKGEPDKQQSGNWFTRLWSTGDKAPPKKGPAAPKKIEPSPDEIAARRRAKEEAALNRRNEVILKLREIAVRTQDDLLLRKADDLQQRAWDLYLQKTEALSGLANTFAPAKSLSVNEVTDWEDRR